MLELLIQGKAGTYLGQLYYQNDLVEVDPLLCTLQIADAFQEQDAYCSGTGQNKPLSRSLHPQIHSEHF